MTPIPPITPPAEKNPGRNPDSTAPAVPPTDPTPSVTQPPITSEGPPQGISLPESQTASQTTPQTGLQTGSQPTQVTAPLASVHPVLPPSGLGSQLAALLRFLMKTEVHTYAFSVAANVILSLFPFIVMLLTLCRSVFHSHAMEQAVVEMMTHFLPSNQQFILRNMQILAHPRKGTQLYSAVMLLVSSTGVFLPLEVALNNVWGVRANRSYLRNQLVAISLALAIGVLGLASVALTDGQRSVLGLLFFEHTDNLAYRLLDGGMLRILGLLASFLIFFLIYWVLPNRKLPIRAVVPTAIVIGVLWEGAKYLYVLVLPRLDFASVYGPFSVSVGLMIWSFLSGLLLLAGAHFSATRYALAVARQEEQAQHGDHQPDAAG